MIKLITHEFYKLIDFNFHELEYTNTFKFRIADVIHIGVKVIVFFKDTYSFIKMFLNQDIFSLFQLHQFS